MYKTLKLKRPYKIGLITIASISLISIGIMIGITIGRSINKQLEIINPSGITEYVCINGSEHNYSYIDYDHVRVTENDKKYEYEIKAYMCKRCGYDKKIEMK